MADGVGVELRRARERAHLSLEDLTARTKIRVVLLEAIEREQFERLPAGLLTRGYLRAYAREVGLDPESIVQQYVAGSEPERLASEQPGKAPHETEWEPETAARTRWAILAPAIPLMLASVFFARMNRPAELAPPAVEPIGTGGQPVDLVAGEQTTTKVEAMAPVREGLRVEIHPTAPTWIDAAADGTRVLCELVDAGQRRTIEAGEEITLRIGDAGAFAYAINGRPGRTLGGPGEVRDIRISRENLDSFLIRE